jgi:hypothetical protein
VRLDSKTSKWKFIQTKLASIKGSSQTPQIILSDLPNPPPNAPREPQGTEKRDLL